MRESGSPERRAPRDTDCGKIGSAEPFRTRRRQCRHRSSGLAMIELPGVIESGMSGKNGQRKPGTTRGSPRRSRTAKASRISRPAVKSRCASEWGGWGRLSDDGPGQHNPDPSEDPWGGGYPPSTAVHWRVTDPTLSGVFVDTNAMHEGRKQTNTGPAHAGSRLKLTDALGRRRPKCHPSSCTGENPPYGMIGGIEETSASFEARSAPRSYPTAGLRVSELTGLKIDDIDLPSMSIRVLGKGRRERTLPLWKPAAAALRAWLAIRGQVATPEVFVDARGEPLSRWGFAYLLKQHVATAARKQPGLAKKRVSPHVLRHTCAMVVLQATGDIRKVSLWLGHATLTTTEVYTRGDPTEKLDAMEAIVPPHLRRGVFQPTDKLIALMKRAS